MDIKTFRKGFELKATLSENMIEGAAAAMGNMDRGNDCIFPGAFKKAINGFKENGFVAVGHDWDDMPVAMPIECAEKGNALMSKAEFHTTAKAQDVRQICAERLAKNLSVGLSIGFSLDYGDPNARMWFDDGAAMAKYIQDAEHYDQAMFDMKGIRACKGQCRGIFQVHELFEWSIVAVPMNPMATATNVKQFAFEPESLADLSAEDHSNSVLAAVRGWADRMGDIKSLREADGRTLSVARRAEIEELKGLLDGLLASDVPSDSARAVLDLKRQALIRKREMAALIGA